MIPGERIHNVIIITLVNSSDLHALGAEVWVLLDNEPSSHVWGYTIECLQSSIWKSIMHAWSSLHSSTECSYSWPVCSYRLVLCIRVHIQHATAGLACRS